MEFINHQPTAGNPQQLPLVHQPQTEAPLILQLGQPLRRTPEATQGPLIQLQTGLPPIGIQLNHSHQQSTARGSISTLQVFAGIL